MDKLSKACFAYRVKHNLTQKQMADLCRLHVLTIQHCESGKKISKMSTAKIVMVVKEER